MGLQTINTATYFSHSAYDTGKIPIANNGYKNTASYAVKITSLTLPMATGKGTFNWAGRVVSGDGRSLDVKLYINGTEVDSVRVSKIVTPSYGSSQPSGSNAYPNTASFVKYEFDGIEAIKIDKNATVSIELGVPPEGACLCMDASNAVLTVERYSSNYIYRWNGTDWKKVRKAYVYKGKSQGWIEVNGVWRYDGLDKNGNPVWTNLKGD